MKKRNNVMKQLFTTSALALIGFVANGQLLETMGTTALGTGTQTISARETAGSFDLTVLTYSGTADMRTTSASTGYAGASGGYNTLIQAQETFEMQGVNAAGCRSKDSIFFGIHKNTNASTGIDFLVLEYSIDNGATWAGITFPALPTGTGTSKWYKVGAALPAATYVANLRVRFRSTLVGTTSSNPQFRIDDIAFTCGSTTSCGDPTASINTSGATVICAGATMPQLVSTTGIIDPFYQWYNQDGVVAGANLDVYTPATSGTYHVVVSSEDGCEAVSEEIYVLVYPQVEYCPITLADCAGKEVSACVNVKAPDLIFSQYVEGSGFNKYLEIYNGTCAAIDLTNYVLKTFHNGAPLSGTPTFTIALSGTIAAGGTIVIAHPSATAWSGTPNIFSANLQFNGDDALVLYNTNTSTVADIFGSVGNDPGSAWRDNDSTSATYQWSTEGKTLVRKACVYSGITVNPGLPGIEGFPTLFTEWDTLSEDNVTGLGAHTFGASSYNFTVASGNGTIVSSTGNCATIEVGSVNSVIQVTGTFCTFNNCNATPGQINVNVDCDGPALKTKSAVPTAELFPNPTTGSVMINFNTTSDEEVSIVLFDLSGKEQMIIQDGLLSKGTHRLQADLSMLAAGTYLIKITSASENQTLRVVKAEK
jgi:hypothetical protein